MKKISLLCATSALVLPSAAFAQSTGSVEFEEPVIIVTGTRAPDVGGIQAPDTSKAKAVLTDEFIQRQTPGQTINDTINQLPGVSFQNNDPYGSAGGTTTIRGFDNTRISQTFDGVPLNDSGNYALFSNQQLDPELIEQVNVNLGSTDVDSPTANASGSTINYRTRLPFQDFGARLQGSVGEFNFFRHFAVLDTGTFGPIGTRAFIASSSASNDNVFNNRGQIDKQQYNARVYQPIGSGGDFISLSGHYNQNRNNFFGSVALRNDLTPLTTGGPPRAVPDRFPQTEDERFYTIARCSANSVARPGVADAANTCGSTFDERFNPSNTGNIRVGSRFGITDRLVLNVDPSYQFVKANGGGTVVAQEGLRDVNPTGGTATPAQCVATPGAANFSCQTGFIGGSPFFGRDLNGDGDRIDTVRILSPNTTRTRRYGVLASLRYELSDAHVMRVAYSFDRARHRQTGEVNLLRGNGEPFDVFPINDPLADGAGNTLQRRDRLSFATLNQISGEYRGEFFDDRLVLTAGIRAPFFKRDLNNFCTTSSAAGFVECFGTNTAARDAFLANNPTVAISGGTQPIQGPQQRVFKYDRILPNVGAVYDITSVFSLFGNYSKGLQVPGTDALYNSFFFAPGNPRANPQPETTDNFDAGVRMRSRNLVAQASGFFTRFSNRLATAFDVELDRNIFRNLGTVDKYGFDGSISYEIIPQRLQFYVYGSYLKSEIKDDLVVGEFGPAGGTQTSVFIPTAGNRESGSPNYTFGGRVQGRIGPVELGAQAKRTGKRFFFDTNLPVFAFISPGAGMPAVQTQVFGAAAPAYTLVDIDARISLDFLGLNDKTFFQLNVTNLFDKLYVGGFGGQPDPRFQRHDRRRHRLFGPGLCPDRCAAGGERDPGGRFLEAGHRARRLHRRQGRTGPRACLDAAA